MGYFEDVKADVREWIENNKEEFEERLLQEEEFEDEDDFKQFVKEWLDNKLWNDDDVTGNSDGYYAYQSDAEQMVLANPEEVKEALQEFCVSAETIAEKFLDRDWNYFDATARCFYLSSAISDVVDEDFEDIENLWLYKYKED